MNTTTTVGLMSVVVAMVTDFYGYNKGKIQKGRNSAISKSVKTTIEVLEPSKSYDKKQTPDF